MIFVQSEATAARRRFPVYLVDATDGITPETGENGGQPQVREPGLTSWTNTSATLVAVGNGSYYVELTTGEIDTLGHGEIRYKSANTAEFNAPFTVVAVNIYDSVRMGMTALPNASAGASGGVLISGSNAGTTTLGALTVSGAFTVSGGATYTSSTGTGFTCSSTGGNGHGTLFQGNGTGSGVRGIGGNASTAGHGAYWTGGTGGGVSGGHGVRYERGTDGSGGTDGVAMALTGAFDFFVTGSIIGDITGSLSGSVGSVTGSVGSISGVTFPSGFSTLTVAAIADGVWDEATTGHVTSGTFGEQLKTDVDAILDDTGTSGVIVATGSKTGYALAATGLDLVVLPANIITASSLASDAGAEIADAVWDEAMSGHTTSGTFGQRLQALRTGTAQTGAAGSITLDASASAVTDFYKNALVVITSGTGTGQSRTISAYDGGTKIATISPNWGTTPSSDSVFMLIPAGAVAGASAPTAAEVADAVWDEALAGHATAGSAGKSLADTESDAGAALTAAQDAQTAAEAGLAETQALATQATAIEADTQDIQTRLPAALTAGGNMKADALAFSGSTTAADNAEIVYATDFASNYDATRDRWRANISHFADQAFSSQAGQNINIVFDNNANPTTTIIDAVSTHTAASVWAVATRVLTAGTNIVLPSNGLSNVTAWTVNLTGSLSGSVGSVTGNVGGNVTGSVGSIAGVTFPSGFSNLTLANINAEADAALADIHLDHLLAVDYDPTAKPGVATALLNELVESDAGVSRFTANTLETAPSGTGASADVIADAVWDELLSGHAGAGSAGAGLSAAGSAGDPWTTLLPGAYGAGTAGKIIGDNINATISSRSSHSAADVWSVATRVLTSGANIVLAKGTGITGFNDLSAAQVNAEADTALADVGLTTTITGRIDAAISTRSAHGAGDIWSVATRTLSSGANIVLAKGVGVTGFNDLSEAQVNAQADLALADVGLTTTITGRIDATISSRSTLTGAAAADSVWDELLSGHTTAGTAGSQLSAAGAAGDPWSTLLPGAYPAGTAGFVIGTNLDAPVSEAGGGGAVTITPLQITITNPRYSVKNLASIPAGTEPTDVLAVSDAAGNPVDLTGKELRLVAYTRADEYDEYDPAHDHDPWDEDHEAVFKYETGAELTIGGASGNQVTIAHDSSKIADAGRYRYFLINVTDSIVLAKGRFPVEPSVLDLV